MGRGKPAKRYSQAGRVHDIIRLIEARHGMTVEELVEETGVTRRTIHRDMNVIHEAGYPLVSEWQNGQKSYRFLTRFKDVPPVSFTLQELATMYFLRSQSEIFHGTPFAEELEGIFRKVRSVLPPRFAAHLERIAGAAIPLFQGRHDYTGHAETIKQVRDALVHQNRLTVSYRASGREHADTYLVDPYTLAFYKGGLYLIAYAHNRGAFRTFAMERISSVTMERERFELPDDYQPEGRLRDAFGIVAEDAMAVRIRFSPVVADSVKGRIWHPSQKFTDTKDGGVELTFSAGGKLEIASWVLSYGEHAEVLAPVELRDMLHRAVTGLSGIYGR
ncbi:HTH domain protein [Geobacter sp. OR-1]|uniref:helix-turn-helix transcriptional regulator n=1 Tax=Geobacter sp. OR-1 TaxID=1266765 RepID=UPI000542A44E|nr:transcriptional regulator [Geobacter sp. OR-1]GAM09861.1 HTH domain protein [Geobacter sp. OR-1]